MPDIIYKYDQLTARKKYEKKPHAHVKDMHWGQRKLLIGEVYFLTKYFDPTKIILYVGAADGYHIKFMAEVMFPKNKFILYDPAHFKIKATQQIEIHKAFFTDADAKKYAANGANILFISDIRNLDVQKARKADNVHMFDDIVVEDLTRQRKWVEIIRPYRSFLKFRNRYDPGKSEYFDGPIYLQPWAPVSTETRMIVRKQDIDKMAYYDNAEFDEKLYYFNTQIRPKPNDAMKSVLDKLNIINCWDTNMELLILKKYLKYVTKNYNEQNLIKLFTDITAYLTAENRAHLSQLKK
ncbi:MAG: polyA polymerase regulatory subunit [Faunusvirus sp.]|jgi:hypothetical protein|uniref:Cap-specific mRNA (nucleoside-2'-O-)-methyltransferase n=1 Tax=Faunusvirus sp. TaxID=2487766 RepID=A0A3G5A2H8_9VIRU|nr:MAG: polyA polymerase regulatory subunit [Faunusvirus sp.]